ncbi:cystathionine beta-lyase [Pseudomonas aeruginosa]|nr:cystathionine beta-lyase [Pseudomonas aeruginosa]MDI4074128.1 cystathionine beta-lyase [Pseudomonas aeruginosa]
MSENPRSTWRPDTQLTHLGRDPASHQGTVNTPVYRASTFIWDSPEALEDYHRHGQDPEYRGHLYGRNGNPTTAAFEDAVAELEGGFRALVMPSGLAAIVGAVLAVARSGEHILVTANCYWHARQVFDSLLPRYGIDVSYFEPMAGEAIAELIRPQTRALYLEAPGSNTFEVQDVPGLARIAHAHGLAVLLDNTWATPLYFKAFEHGVDISIHAATKYLVGHSDAMLGVIVTTRPWYVPVRNLVREMGYIAGADDAYLGLRGLRTLGVRLRQHERSALAVAHWLQQRPEVARVLHPALPGHPGHAFWKRDFRGASGLFGLVLKAQPQAPVDAFLARLRLFAQGASWGGYESLVRQQSPREPGPAERLLRLHVGLEAVEDLLADLAQALEALAPIR